MPYEFVYHGWQGKGHTWRNPITVTLDHDYVLPTGHVIPANTPHKQWETRDFGWWLWRDNSGNLKFARY